MGKKRYRAGMQSSSPSETRLPVYQGLSRDQMYNGHRGDVCRVTATTCTYLIMWGRMWSRTHYINETWIKLIAFLPPTEPFRSVNEYRGLRYHRHAAAAAVLIMLVLSRESRMSADISRWYFTACSCSCKPIFSSSCNNYILLTRNKLQSFGSVYMRV